ncbi:MAG TPA: DUF6544 family protein [Vicinamibacterales bacterium]
MTFRRVTLLVVLLLVLVVAVAMWIGTRGQQQALADDIARLMAARTADASSLTSGDKALEGLPPPVARYLRLALRTRRAIEEVRIAQTGTVRTDPTSERWMSFEAEHLAVPPATGFHWNARVQIAPMLHVGVRDALIDGVGSGQVSLLSAFPVSSATGGIEMNAGSLHRYLAEAVWYPDALLPGPHLQWTPIDDNRALATLTHGDVSVSLEFRFADSGEATGIYTPARWGKFGDAFRQIPWEGHFRDYRERDGVVVPTYGEVGWYVRDEWRAVWKGTVTAYRVRFRE